MAPGRGLSPSEQKPINVRRSTVVLDPTGWHRAKATGWFLSVAVKKAVRLAVLLSSLVLVSAAINALIIVRSAELVYSLI